VMDLSTDIAKSRQRERQYGGTVVARIKR
jgi:hypothetical protein